MWLIYAAEIAAREMSAIRIKRYMWACQKGDIMIVLFFQFTRLSPDYGQITL